MYILNCNTKHTLSIWTSLQNSVIYDPYSEQCHAHNRTLKLNSMNPHMNTVCVMDVPLCIIQARWAMVMVKYELQAEPWRSNTPNGEFWQPWARQTLLKKKKKVIMKRWLVVVLVHCTNTFNASRPETCYMQIQECNVSSFTNLTYNCKIWKECAVFLFSVLNLIIFSHLFAFGPLNLKQLVFYDSQSIFFCYGGATVQ